MSAGSNPTMTAAGGARGKVMDLTANEDHYRLAQANPRAVVAYLNEVNNAAYSRPRMTTSGDIVRTLTPDNGNTGIKTGLKAHVITVFTTPSNAFYRRQLVDKDGVTLSEQDFHSQAKAEADGRKAIAIELRRRGIY